MEMVFIFIFGLIIGSFLNVVIFRLHHKKNFWGRSACIKCQKKVQWYDNIPLFSFLNLRGRCRACKSKISSQYPLVELTAAILFVLAYWEAQFSIFNFNFFGFLYLVRNLAFVSILIIIFVYDLRWYLILDAVVLPAATFALLVNLLLDYSFINLVLGAIIGGGVFLVQYLISSGKWIGGGDIRLGVLMGLMLGWQMTLVALFLAYFFGSLISICLIIFKKKKFSSKVPFGTFLATSTVISLFFGEKILQWYLNFIF